MGVKYKSEISLIGLVNWVLGLEKGTIWIVPFFSFMRVLLLDTNSRYCVLANHSKGFGMISLTLIVHRFNSTSKISVQKSRIDFP